MSTALSAAAPVQTRAFRLGDAALVPALAALFFASGVSGLVYEVVWLRHLTLIFGVTVYAVSTVLTVFMAGLALGGLLASRVADSLRRPLRVYGLVEIGIGAGALLTPPAFVLLGHAYRWLYPALPHDLTSLSLVRFLLAAPVLLLPTTLMGTTLPLVVRSSLGRRSSLGTSLSVLYASNTAGGIAGAYLAGFVLIGAIGVGATTLFGAGLNLAVGVAAVALDAWLAREGGQSEAADETDLANSAPAIRAGQTRPVAGATTGQISRKSALPGGQVTGGQVTGAPALLSTHEMVESLGLGGQGAGERVSLDTPAMEVAPNQAMTADACSKSQSPAHSADGSSASLAPATLRWLLAAFFVSGLASLAYQVIWTRLLAIFFEATTYAFTLILCTFLLGIAVGSYVIAPLINRRANWLAIAAVLEWAIGVTALLSITAISQLHALVTVLRTLPVLEHLVSGEQRATAVMAVVTILPCTLLLGAAFPVIMKLYATAVGGDGRESESQAGRRLGHAYAANVCGAIVGSWVAGFVLIPALGTQRSLILLGFVNVAVALGLGWSALLERGRASGRAPHTSAGTPYLQTPDTSPVRPGAWPAANAAPPSPDVSAQRSVARPARAGQSGLASRALITVAAAVIAVLAASLTPDLYAPVFARFGDPVLWYEEGLEQTVTVLQGPTVRRMFLNGWHQADDSPGTLDLHDLIGHLPMLVQPPPAEGGITASPVAARATTPGTASAGAAGAAGSGAAGAGTGGSGTTGAEAAVGGTAGTGASPAGNTPRRSVLVIGLGGGASAGAAAAYEDADVDVVELSDSVVRGARFFSHVNNHVLQRPNVRFLTDDGRNFMLLTDRKYDVVMADAVQARHAGSAALYSVEYFRLARAVLKPNGLMVQWIDTRLPENQHQLLVRTFMEVFPAVSAWKDGALLVGALAPYPLDEPRIAGRMSGTARAALDSVGLNSAGNVVGLFTAGDAELRAYAGSGPIVSDDRPYIEFFRSLPHDDHPLDPARFSHRPQPLLQ